MSIIQFSRQVKWVVSAALLGVVFAGCSGAEEDETPAPGDTQTESSTEGPSAEESVGGIPECQPGCFGSEQACRDGLAGRPDCFCTTDPGCCALPQFSMLCEP